MLSTPPLFFNFHHPYHFSHKDANHIHDLSSYLLFEATGDSEVNSEANSTTSNTVEFDDAESCTNDTPALRDGFVRYDDDDEDEDDDDEEEMMLENDEVVESKPPIGFTTKSNASIGSTKEFKVMNEVDKNRLFWEACLAS